MELELDVFLHAERADAFDITRPRPERHPIQDVHDRPVVDGVGTSRHWDDGGRQHEDADPALHRTSEDGQEPFRERLPNPLDHQA